MTDLRLFATAAARRYSGTYQVKASENEPERVLPAVRHWLAWNEPNNPVFLQPQWKKVGGKWRPQSAFDYAKICSAVWAGVHATGLSGEKVACGATGPRGNDAPASSRPSTSPLVFLTWLRRAGLRHFDAYAHHPYYGSRLERPTTVPKSKKAITLGNINVLIKQLNKLYGRGKRLWITEYGYQTSPPDLFFGVTLHEPGEVRPPGDRPGAQDPPDRHVRLVPDPRRAPEHGLAVGRRHGEREAEAGVPRLPDAPLAAFRRGETGRCHP